MAERESMIDQGAIGSEKANVSISTHYMFSAPLYKKIKELGMTVTGFCHKNNQVVFTYTAKGRRPFDYTELLQLQRLINPKDDTNYPIPVGYYGEYSLYIPLPVSAR